MSHPCDTCMNKTPLSLAKSISYATDDPLSPYAIERVMAKAGLRYSTMTLDKVSELTPDQMKIFMKVLKWVRDPTEENLPFEEK